MSVLLFQRLQVVQFILERDYLVLKLDDLSLAVDQLGFLILEIVGLRVNEFVQIINSCELLGNIVLEGSCLGSEVGAFLALKIILVIELVNFLGILSVSIP